MEKSDGYIMRELKKLQNEYPGQSITLLEYAADESVSNTMTIKWVKEVGRRYWTDEEEAF